MDAETKALLDRALAAEKSLLTAQSFVDFAVKLTGAQNADEARGKLEGLKQRNEELQREVIKTKADGIGAEAKAELAKAKGEKKVTPAEEENLLKAVLGDGKIETREALDAAERQLSWLKGFLSVKAPVAGAAGTTTETKKGNGEKTTVTEAPRAQVEAPAALTVNIEGKDLKFEELSSMQKHELRERDPQLAAELKADWQRRKKK
jgi:hypothetical protein